MKSSRVIIFIAVILIFIVIFLKFSQNKVATLPAAKKSNPAPLSQATSQTAAPPQSQPTTTPTYAEPEEADTTPQPSAYVSEYKGKSQSFMDLKRKVAMYALREFLSDKGLRFDPPITFYDFTIFESDLNTVGFDGSPNELQQELIAAFQRTTDAKGFLTELAAERGISLGGAIAPRPLDGRGNFFLIARPELNAVYYVGPAKSGHSAVIALIQKNPIPTSLIEAFRNSIVVGGN